MNWLESADISEDFCSENNVIFDEMCLESGVDHTQNLDYYEDFGSDESTNIYSSIKSSPAEPLANFPSILINRSNMHLNYNQPKARKIWTPEEDEHLSKLAQKYKNNWNKVSKYMPSRSIRSIQKRWMNRHDPTIKKSRWTPEEDSKILQLYQKFGGRWEKIAQNLPGRPPDSVKNRFYGSIKKKLSPEEQLKYSRRTHDIRISNSHIGMNSLQGGKQTQLKCEDDIVNSFLAISDSSPSNETLTLCGKVQDFSFYNKPKEETCLSPETRREKIIELYTKMQALESFLLQTKCEMRRLEQSNYSK